jgi:ABC-type glycerol-3-phosphate transport system substrate-binding protein
MRFNITRNHNLVCFYDGANIMGYKTSNPEIAWELLKFIYSRENCLYHLAEYDGGVPTRVDVSKQK